MIFLYGGVKLAAYSLWCWAGLRAFRPEAARWGPVLGLGALRLFMGLFFGILIWFLSSAAMRPLGGSQPLVYLCVYVPVRWIEWGIIDALIRPAGVWGFLFGADASGRGWRARGIAVSCLADVPMIVSLGGIIPVGRFMC